MKIQELHREAVNLAKQANLELDNQNFAEYKRLITNAYELERKAAEFLKHEIKSEPTRSVLYRSAATLAFQCEKYSESIDLIAQALSGNPFEEIKVELIDLLTKAVSSKTNVVKSNDYLNSLRSRSVSLKLEDKTGKYGGAFVISHIIDFLKNVNQSYQNYAEVQFTKSIDKDSLPDFDYALSKFKSSSKLLGANTIFSSFGINISVDKSGVDNFDVFTKEFKVMRDNLFTEFKEDVIYPDYEDTIFQERITQKFTDEERKKIFSPVLNSITNSKEYKISLTDYEFKTKIKEFRPLNITTKNALIPVVKKELEAVEEDTSLTRKIEQTTGKTKKIIFAENIKYLEQEYTFSNFEFDKKKIYFNDPNIILIIFEDNYYRIEDDKYKIAVSNKDFDGLLNLYSKSFILKYSTLLLEKENNTNEEKELLDVYETTTVRDW